MRIRLPLAGLCAVYYCLGAHHATAATLPARQPGMWQSTTYVTLPDGSKAEGGNAIVTVSCVDALTDTKFFLVNGSQCSNLNVSGGGGQYAIDGTCTQANGQPASIHTVLNYADANTVELNGTVTSGSGTITLQSELKYIGGCVAGMAPGDEGSIANGVFTKTDNINDSANQ